jgi:hypothetical protein
LRIGKGELTETELVLVEKAKGADSFEFARVLDRQLEGQTRRRVEDGGMKNVNLG